METTLVIMAAGLGSRYGGNKQIDGVGPDHEILMEYSIFDAIRAGFDKVVFIIKPEILTMVKEICGDRISHMKTAAGKNVEVFYVFQDYASVPSFYKIPADRTKPFGTTHAVLCARDVVHEPFCVINADDYYGVDAYRTIYEELHKLPASGKATMVGYLLKNTVSEFGTVSRGVCQVRDENLAGVKETLKIQLFPDGSIANVEDGTRQELDPDSVVSMNFWGFTPSIFDEMAAYFNDFLRQLQKEENSKAECLLPNMVGEYLQKGKLSVSVLHSSAHWFGMTYQEDKAFVAGELKKLHEDGTYPPSLKKL